MASQNPEIHTDEIALFSRPPVGIQANAALANCLDKIGFAPISART